MRKTYYEPIFKLWLTAFIEPSPEKAKKIAERIIGDTLDEVGFNCQAKTIEYRNNAGGQRLVLWFRQRDLSLLSHELVHVVEYCFSARRIPFNLDNSETIAYYVEHLFSRFSPIFTSRKNKTH